MLAWGKDADDKLAVVFLQRRPRKGWFAVSDVSLFSLLSRILAKKAGDGTM
jgi:hypothetical protein